MAIDFGPQFFGATPFLRARAPAIGTTELNVYNVAQAIRWATVFDTGYQLDLSSSSVADVNTSGTGAWTVEIYGLDKDFNPLRETIALNGQTKITTVNSFRRVFEVVVQSAGAGNANAGDIYIYKTGTGGTITVGVPGTLTGVAAKMLAAGNYGLSGLYTIPNGKKMALIGLGITCRAQPGTLYLQHGFPTFGPMPWHNNLVYPSLKIDYTPANPYVLQTDLNNPLMVLLAGEDIYFTALCTAAGGFISTWADFQQMNNN